MLRQPERRFGLADALILVAAIAIGFALFESTVGPASWPVYYSSRPLLGLSMVIDRRLRIGLPFLAPFTCDLFIICMRTRRPRSRRLRQEPGAVACAVATLAMSLEAVFCLFALPVKMLDNDLSFDIAPLALNMGWAVFGSWAALV
jgi:hypothetical protein